METVAVLGSNSFSGSDFVDLLLEERKYKIVGISRSNEKSALFLPYKKRADLSRISFHALDLNRDMDAIVDLLDNVKPAYVINFAAQSEVAPSWENPGQWFQTNAVAIANLSHALKSRSWLKKYVHISSPEVYGTCEGVVKEDAPVNPSTPYAASKAAGDMMLYALVKNYDFPLVMIRATNVYGAHQQLFKIIPRSIIYIKSGKMIELHGGGVAVKSYIHIRDVSRGELAAMEQGSKGEIYHLSPDQGIAVKGIVQSICNKMGKSFENCAKSTSERLGQDKAYVIDSSKARNQFNWKPQISFDDGLKSVIDWIENDWDLIQKEPLHYNHKS